MFQQSLVNLRQALEDGDVGRKFLAHLHKSADDIKAHLSRLRTVQDVGRLQRAVFGENADAFEKFVAAQGCHSL